MIGQHLVAGLADAGAVLLQTGEHGGIAVIHHRAAMTRDVARASIVLVSRCAEAGEAIKTSAMTKRNLTMLFRLQPSEPHPF